jgi:sialic acid synthase SpsE
VSGILIGDGYAPFIVAEVGVNHDGYVDQALSMIRAAAKADVDAVKFGVFKADEFCSRRDPLYETFKRCELPDSAWAEIKAECERNDVIFFATPQNRSDLDILLDVGVPFIKIGSDDLANVALVESYAETKLPIILSTGMADLPDIYRAVDAVVEAGSRAVICVCTSEYPCPAEHANLGRITTLREAFPTCPIGFSDHTIGPMAGMIAATLGAAYFEKHFTLDNDLHGPDHSFSANPEQLSNWAWSIRSALVMLGDGLVRPTEEEKRNRVKWRRASGQRIRGFDERNAA